MSSKTYPTKLIDLVVKKKSLSLKAKRPNQLTKKRRLDWCLISQEQYISKTKGGVNTEEKSLFHMNNSKIMFDFRNMMI